MPKVTISKPFNYQHGGEVKRYKVGVQDVPHAVADHAKAKGSSSRKPPQSPPRRAKPNSKECPQWPK